MSAYTCDELLSSQFIQVIFLLLKHFKHKEMYNFMTNEDI